MRKVAMGTVLDLLIGSCTNRVFHVLREVGACSKERKKGVRLGPALSYPCWELELPYKAFDLEVREETH
jgi:hypothetical protein